MKKSTIVIVSIALLTLANCASSKSKEQAALAIIPMETVRELTLNRPLEAGRKAHVSAASGLVKVGDRFYLAADDELSIFTFSEKDKNLSSVSLSKGSLPADYTKRKAAKPDIEGIAALASSEWPPYGAIVAWPSGSMPTRMKAFVFRFGKNQKLEKPIVSDISALGAKLQAVTKELNIEGILVRDGKIVLFQRGNSAKGENGFVEMALSDWVRGMKTGKWDGKIDFHPVKMGKLEGVKLTFSDVAWTKNGLLALGSAEDTQSAYADGHVYGTVLARIDGDNAEILGRFEPTSKLEGIFANETADGVELYLVEDADSADKPSHLFKAKLK